MSRWYIHDAESAARADDDLHKMRAELEAFEQEGDDQEENAAQVREQIDALQDELDLYLDDRANGGDKPYKANRIWI